MSLSGYQITLLSLTLLLPSSRLSEQGTGLASLPSPRQCQPGESPEELGEETVRVAASR